jgi:hypothetical protein
MFFFLNKFHVYYGLPFQVSSSFPKDAREWEICYLAELDIQLILHQHAMHLESSGEGMRLGNCNSMSRDMYQLKSSYICIPTPAWHYYYEANIKGVAELNKVEGRKKHYHCNFLHRTSS